ncbi:DUF927 domain-containing protein [Dehalococcoides mccartyi]|nr:DUF927 domain-containing protein [Dehalococcoides mccartyi]
MTRYLSGAVSENIPVSTGMRGDSNASIKEVIIKDDGADQAGYFKVSGINKDGCHLPTAEVPLKSFNSMNWVTEAWNLRAIIRSENNTERKLREAIMLQSEDAPVRNVFTHIGWRQVDDKQVYLSSNGGLGIDNAEVELDQQLGRYYIPQPSGEAKEAMKHSLDMIDVSRRREVTLPLWASMFLSPLADIIHPSFTLWYVGASGSFKSTLTSLALCHFGDFDSRHIPASWVDTDNALEKLMFLCKDAPLLIDDWAPGQDAGKARQLETRAERIVRAQGNRQGKGRLRSDTSARPSYIPRGMLITSGEQLPSGHSHTARLYTVELEREDIIKNLVILFPTIVMAFLTLCMAGGIFAPPLLFFPEYIEKLAELLNAKTGAELFILKLLPVSSLVAILACSVVFIRRAAIVSNEVSNAWLEKLGLNKKGED